MRPTTPLVSAMLATGATALAAPWLLGAAPVYCFAAGAIAILAGAALGSLRPAEPGGPALPWPLGLGLIVATATAAVPLVPATPPWLAALGSLASAACLFAGVTHLIAARSRDADRLAVADQALARREGDVRAQAERIRRLEAQDPVTGLLNQRGFIAVAQALIGAAAAAHEPLALVVIALPAPLARQKDLDPHEDGAQLGRAVLRVVRGSDVVGRWDDSTIAVLLPACGEIDPVQRRLEGSLRPASRGPEFAFGAVSVTGHGPWPDAAGLVVAARAALRAGAGPAPVPGRMQKADPAEIDLVEDSVVSFPGNRTSRGR